jgi:hypothetical protein
LPARRKPSALSRGPQSNVGTGQGEDDVRPIVPVAAEMAPEDPMPPAPPKLRITIIKAKNLRHRQPGPLPDCFAEVYVSDKVLRSEVVKATVEPCRNDNLEVQVQGDDTIRIAIIDELRTKESDYGFLGLVAFDVKDRMDLDGKEDKVVELKLTSPQKQAWYGSNDVTGSLNSVLRPTTPMSSIAFPNSASRVWVWRTSGSNDVVAHNPSALSKYRIDSEI